MTTYGLDALPSGKYDVQLIGLLRTSHEPEAVDPTQPTLGRSVMHRHDLVHEDHDMMNQFEVVPGATESPTGPSTTTTTPGGKAVARPAMAPAMMAQWTLQA